MIAHILTGLGLDLTVLAGGNAEPMCPCTVWAGTLCVVAEADESDGSFLRYYPEIADYSVEADHPENYGRAALVVSYKAFVMSGNISHQSTSLRGSARCYR